MTDARNRFDRLLPKVKPKSEALWAMTVLAVGLFLSIAGFLELQTITRERLFLETEKHVRSQVEQIQTNLNISLDSLSNVAALYHAAGDISTEQLQRIFNTETHYHAGTLGLAWVPKVRRDQVAEFEKKVQAEGNDVFHIFELTGHGIPRPINKHKTYFPVRSIYPELASDLRLGLNLSAIPSRSRVMIKARTTRKTAIIEKVSIFNDGRHLYGFQAYHPLFEQRKGWLQELVGYVVGVYDFKALFGDVFPKNEADIALFDSGSSSLQLLYSSSKRFSNVRDVTKSKRFRWTFPIIVADKQWILSVFPDMRNQTLSNNLIPYIGLAAGGGITLLLTLYLFISLLRTRQVIELSSDLAGTTTQLDIQRRLKQEADNASRAKSTLLRAASHDLRQPLHTIGLLTSLLRDNKEPQQQQKLADKVMLAVESMNNMFGALLDMSLLESGQLTVNVKSFYISELLEKLSFDYQLQANKKGLDLRLVNSSACVKTDPALLERMLRNLLSNAIRYTENGSVLLGCRRLPESLRICVLDSGIGMSEEVQQHISEEFFRDESARQLVDNGLGLGLSIVSKTAEALDVQFGFVSKLGQGSQFYIDVPYGDPQTVKPVAGTDETAGQLQRYVWLIEDDDDTRYGLEQLLTQWDCDWISIKTGEELDQILAEQPDKPDMIIADYQLVNETGLSLVARIQQHFQQKLPVLMVTGSVESITRRLIKQAGHDMLLKPVKPEHLYQWLKTH